MRPAVSLAKTNQCPQSATNNPCITQLKLVCLPAHTFQQYHKPQISISRFPTPALNPSRTNLQFGCVFQRQDQSDRFPFIYARRKSQQKQQRQAVDGPVLLIHHQEATAAIQQESPCSLQIWARWAAGTV